jgi:uncharacterized protein (TIRG00374 family)
MKRSIPLVLGLAALGYLFWRFGLDDVRRAFGHAHPGLLIVYLMLALVVLAGYCARWKLVAATFGRQLPWRRLLEARLAGDAVGWLVPSAKLAGEPVRVALVMREGLRAPEASAGVAIDRLLELIGNMICVLAYVSVFSLARAGGSPAHVAGAAVLAGLAALAVPLVLLFAGRRPLAPLYGERARGAFPRLVRSMDVLRATEDHLSGFFRDHPAAFLRGLLVSLLVEALIIVEYHFLLRTFGVEIGIPVLLMVLLGSGLAHVLPTPAGIGALEASQVAVLAITQGAPAEGLVVGVVLRLHETLWIAAGLAVLAWSGVAGGLLGPSVEGDGVAA